MHLPHGLAFLNFTVPISKLLKESSSWATELLMIIGPKIFNRNSSLIDLNNLNFWTTNK
jgi:hypothetical protein